MYQVPVFKGENVSNREKWKKKKKKKKITKNSHKSCFWHFRKTAKKYIIKNTYISTHKLYIYKYIYIYSGTTRETEEGLKAGDRYDKGPPLPSLPSSEEVMREGKNDPGNLNFRIDQNSDHLEELRL